ncbi:MAG: hypothetical protein KC502_15115 [Myxococcales bacterium]|nr:hypothetical protein [Myxococcales bacterium]
MRADIARLAGLTALCGVVLAALMMESITAPLGFGGAGADLRSAVTPHWEFIAAAYRDGRLPLWNPHIFTGQPELAGAQWGILYPVQAALLLLLSVKDAILATLWLHLCLTFAAGYLLSAAWLESRGLQRDTSACLLGGTSLLGSGVVMGHVYAGHPMLVQATPWYVLGIAAGLWALKERPLAAPIASACFALGVLAGGIVIAPYVALTALAVWGVGVRRPPMKAIGALFLWLLMAVALAAGQLLPALELTENSGRRLLNQLQIHHSFLLRSEDLLGLVRPTATLDWERSAFVGAPLVGLAAAGLWAPHRRTAMALWVACALAFLLGSESATEVVSAIPGLQWLRVPARSVWIVTLLLPLVALETWVGSRSSLVAAAWMTGALALAVGMSGGGLPAGLLGLAAAGGLAARGFSDAPRVRSGALVSIALVSLLGAALSFKPLAPGRTLPPPLREVFVKAAPNQRVLTETRRLWNVGMRHGYLNLGGYDPLLTARAMTLGQHLSAKGQPNRMVAIVPDRPAVPSPLWERLGVGFVLAQSSAQLAQWGRKIGQQGPNALYQAKHVTPRAYLSACPLTAGSVGDALTQLAAADGARVAVVEASKPTCTRANEGAQGHVQIDLAEAEQLILSVQTTTPTWLIVNDLNYPGWQAWVDGAPEPLVHANGVGRGVQLRAGQHRVEMHFRPQSVRLGLWMSAVAWLLWLVWLIVLLRRRTARLATLKAGHAVGQGRDEADALLAAEDLELQ